MASDFLDAIEKDILPSVFDLLAIERPPPTLPTARRHEVVDEITHLLHLILEAKPENAGNMQGLNELLQASFGSTLKARIGRDPLDLMIDQLQSNRSSLLVRYFSGTAYLEYLESIQSLVKLIFHAGLAQTADAFVKKAQGTADFLPFVQSFTRTPGRLRFLGRRSGRIDRRIVESCRTMYSELSGYYEKQISLILGVRYITRTQQHLDYEYYRQRPLYRNLGDLGRDPLLHILTTGFVREIRNALAHGSIVLSPRRRTIDFFDGKSSIRLTYREFYRQTRELNALVYATSQYNNIFNAEKLILIKKLRSAAVP